jgi:hypothetical protein
MSHARAKFVVWTMIVSAAFVVAMLIVAFDRRSDGVTPKSATISDPA